MQVPFGVSTLAQVAAVASLSAEDELLARVQLIVAERDRVVAGLIASGLHPADTEANFVWLRLGDRTIDFATGCDGVGLSVRPFAGEGVRLTIGERAANDRLLEFADGWAKRAAISATRD